MKKILPIALVLIFVLSMMSIATLTSSANRVDGATVLYEFTFESAAIGSNTTPMKKAGVDIGEVVEFPPNSGNHCLRYTIDATTRSGAGGAHPYIWPQAFAGILAAQGNIPDGGWIEFNADMATDGSTSGAYMYPFMLINGEVECYFQSDCGIYTPGVNEFKKSSWIAEAYTTKGAAGMGDDLGYPLAGQESGGIAFCDENTLDEDTYIYIDNIQFIWHGASKKVTDAVPAYNNGSPCEYTEAGTAPQSNTSVPSTPTSTTSRPSTSTTSAIASGKGDVNGDGSVDMKDVLAIRKHMANMAVSPFNEDAADYNSDGSIDMKDILGIRKKMANL